MRNPFVLFFCAMFLIILLFSYSSILYLAFDHRIDSEKIKKIKLGMSTKEVTSILGQPLDIKDTYLKDGKTYIYTQPIDYAMTYPML